MSGAVVSLPTFLPNVTCATDLSAKQYTAVKVSAAGPVVAAVSAATDKPIGILYDTPNGATVAASALIAHTGQTRWKCGAAVAAGARVQTDANGKAITAVATGYVVGVALTSTANADEELVVSLDCANPQLVA